LPLHNLKKIPLIPPPQRSLTELPILTKLSESYKLWHDFLAKFPRLSRFTVGAKIDNLFTDCLELALLAGYAARGEKLQIIQRLSNKLDLLKFFLKIAWEIRALDINKYTNVSNQLVATGKMLGGWLNMLKNN